MTPNQARLPENLCFFAAEASRQFEKTKKPQAKNYPNTQKLKAQELLKQYFKLDVFGLNKKMREFKGVLLTEQYIKPYCDFFKINLFVYEYDKDRNQYSVSKCFNYGHQEILHILEYDCIFDNKVQSHLMHVLNHERLTGILICQNVKVNVMIKDNHV
jgi:hypothetical protein